MIEREVCFLLDASHWDWGGGVWVLVQRLNSPRPPDNQWARVFMDRGRGLHAERAHSALTVLLKLVISGLIANLLIVLNTINLQFQGWFAPISFRPFIGIVAAYVVASVWLSRS